MKKAKKPFNWAKAFKKESKHAVPVAGLNWSELKTQLVAKAKDKRVTRQTYRVIAPAYKESANA